jgi:phosphopantetheinyl transferase
MVRMAKPDEPSWLDGRLQEVPHQLGHGVAIWRVDVPPDAIVPAEAVGQSELKRSERMRDPVEAFRFLASHAVLRSILALALGHSRSRLELLADELGKPRLAGDPSRFNMSRSGPEVLVGISETSEIGVDIEMVRKLPDQKILARTHLSRREYEAWRGCNAVSPEAGFLEFWTRKEACVKAAGIGLAMPLGLVDVRCGAEQAPVPVNFRSGPHDWRGHVVSLPMPSGLVAAAALITQRAPAA